MVLVMCVLDVLQNRRNCGRVVGMMALWKYRWFRNWMINRAMRAVMRDFKEDIVALGYSDGD